MFFEAAVRQKAVLSHRKAFSNCIDIVQYQHRNYLILLSHFSDNLNASIKNFQDCITDLEEHPRFKITPSERQFLNCELQYLYDLHLDRLCKESYYRNTIIRKSYNNFLENYSLIYSKIKSKEYQKPRHFNNKSFSYKQQKNQRLTMSSQAPIKLNYYNSRKEQKNFQYLSKPMLFQLDVSASLQKHNFQGPVGSNRKPRTKINQARSLMKSSIEDKKNSQFDVIGGYVIVSQRTAKNEQENWQLQSKIPIDVQSFCTNRVLAFRNRISTNPQHQQKQRHTRQNKMLRVPFLKYQNSSNKNKVTKAFQQQIKLIVNTNQ